MCMLYERPFSLLNKQTAAGKNQTRMCKILDCLSQFYRGLWRCFQSHLYLLDGEGLTGGLSAEIGCRIAFLFGQPVLLRICSGKE
jgi:hypothetical protein